GNHDPGNPASRTDLCEDQTAGHLKQDIGQKEQPYAQTIHTRGQAQISVHLQGGDGDIRFVDVSDHVEQHQKWNQLYVESSDGAGMQASLDGIGHKQPSIVFFVFIVGTAGFESRWRYPLQTTVDEMFIY